MTFRRLIYPVCRFFFLLLNMYLIFDSCLTKKINIMKKFTEISIHLLFWILFTSLVTVLSKIYLEAKPDSPFSDHFLYVIFLEVFMGAIFFYTTYLCIPWAKKKQTNALILTIILLFLLMFFAFPAMKIGVLQVMSSIIPHLLLIFVAILLKLYSISVRSLT